MQLSSLFIAAIVPGILFGLPGGAIADRLGPARVYALGASLRSCPPRSRCRFGQGAGVAWAQTAPATPGMTRNARALAWSAKWLTLARVPGAMRLALLGMVAAVFALAALDYGLTAVLE